MKGSIVVIVTEIPGLADALFVLVSATRQSKATTPISNNLRIVNALQSLLI